MRKLNAISLVLFCSLLSALGHGKKLDKKSIIVPVIQGKMIEQSPNSVKAAALFDDSLIPPLLIMLALPT
jgi:hypothetical protein